MIKPLACRSWGFEGSWSFFFLIFNWYEVKTMLVWIHFQENSIFRDFLYVSSQSRFLNRNIILDLFIAHLEKMKPTSIFTFKWRVEISEFSHCFYRTFWLREPPENFLAHIKLRAYDLLIKRYYKFTPGVDVQHVRFAFKMTIRNFWLFSLFPALFDFRRLQKIF